MNEAICNRKSGAAALVIRDCGLMPYGQALALQFELCERRQADAVENTILLVEHPAVITLGARKTENRLLTDTAQLEEQGVEVVGVGRGGGTTAHNPGQIVVYPVMKLKSLGLGITEYVRQLEAIGIGLLADYGIAAGRRKGYPGLWVGPKKIGSIGVQVKRWVTLHGMAINMCNDLKVFEHIVPCGLEGVCMTSAAALSGGEVSMPEAKARLARLCVQAFSSEELVKYEC
ncbi:MAG: lipoyl(octanoyl) transferase LipB [Phycisphaerae bacterium]|nr:lipoyl(octanoyl) transferase LipB [Phycisphaerae bacterium]